MYTQQEYEYVLSIVTIFLATLANLFNRTGIHDLTWSESYSNHIACANHDGSFHLWNVNTSSLEQVVWPASESGHVRTSIDWNREENKDWIVSGSTSSRIQLFHVQHTENVAQTSAEHNQSITSVKYVYALLSFNC